MSQDGIQGVVIQDLNIISDERGAVLHMLRCDSPLYSQFGEVYFSEVKFHAVKAWKRHFKMTQHFAVPIGKIKLVIYDDRPDSQTRGVFSEYYLGRPDDFKLIKIAPMLWYGFQGVTESSALIVNLADIPHDPLEVERVDVDCLDIPYRWE